MVFYRELATLVISGVDVVAAMDILQGHGNGRIKDIAARLKRHISRGGTLADGLSALPDFSPAWHISIVRYSETAGRLADGLNRIADYLEKDYSMFQSLVFGLAYPVLLLHIAVFVLPITSLVTCGLAGYLRELLKVLLPLYGIVFLLFGIRKVFKQARFKNIYDLFSVNVPLWGKLTRRFVATRFVRALECLCASGVTIIEGWKIAAGACGNSIVEKSILRGLAVIERGGGISEAFSATRLFSANMIGMITAGEKSGSIDKMLGSMASLCEKENAVAVAVMVTVVPVFLYIFIAAYIGYRIVMFYTSYFNKIFSF